MFEYRWLTEDTQVEYTAVLDKHATEFLTWLAEKDDRNTWSLERAFASWWFHKGPTGFRTSNDTIRFKRELYEHLVRRRDAVGAAE
jgi:hypothetical protein